MKNLRLIALRHLGLVHQTIEESVNVATALPATTCHPCRPAGWLRPIPFDNEYTKRGKDGWCKLVVALFSLCAGSGGDFRMTRHYFKQ
jgi:hypothetical protein